MDAGTTISANPDGTGAVAAYKSGDYVPILEVQGDRARTPQGWISTKDSSGNSTMTRQDNMIQDDSSHNILAQQENGKYHPVGGTYYSTDGYTTNTTMNTDGSYTVESTAGGGSTAAYRTTYNNDGSVKESYTRSDQVDGSYTETFSSGNNRVETRYEEVERGKVVKTTTTTNVGEDGVETTETTTETIDKGVDAREDTLMERMQKAGSEAWDDLEELFEDGSITGQSRVDGLDIVDVFGIHGLPYQWMDSVDRKGSNSFISEASNMQELGAKFGRMYAEKIISRMPLLFLTPGEPDFLAGWSNEEQKTFLESWIKSQAEEATEAMMKDLMDRTGRFYAFRARSDLYYNYVYPLTSAGATFLGIGQKPAPNGGLIAGETLEEYNWKFFYNSGLNSKIAYRNAIPFYIHSETQITDSFSNGSRQSSLADKVNGYSDMARELQFLMGTGGAMLGQEKLNDTASEAVTRNVENLSNMAGDILNAKDFFKTISQSASTIIQGGKMIFPEIWDGESKLMKSYNVTIKLRTPDADKLSWYFNIYVPLCHLLPLVMPKASGANGYVAPFLVSGFYKGLWQCSMGIITDMQITRGDMCNWTISGLPTAVDVTLTIKDLYDVLTMNAISEGPFNIVGNIGIMDYCANLCGININEPDISRMIRMYYAFGKNKIRALVTNDVYGGITQWLDNYVNNSWAKRIGVR